MAKMKMKGFPLKQIFFNHFEKMLFGMCALLALWMVTQNQWSWLKEQPGEMVDQASAATKRLAESQWPETEKDKLTINDYQEHAKRIPQPINGELFAIKETLFWPLNPKKVPASEPSWYPVEDLIVSSDRAILALKGPQAPLAATPATPEIKTPEPDKNKLDLPATLPGLGDVSAPLPVTTSGGQPGASTFDPQAVATAFSGLKGGGLGGAFGGRRGRRGREEEEDLQAIQARAGTAAGAGQVAPTQQVKGDDGQGYRYVAIRGVYPWKKQLSELVDSKTFSNLNEALNPELFSLVDFQIQRREAIPGADPWGGEWEPINVDEVQKFLTEKSFNLDPDPVDPVDTDPVITMPIPTRAFGGWPLMQVTHPRIKTLSAKQLEENLEQQKKLLENSEALKKEEESSRKKKGFSSLVRDVRSVQSYQQYREPDSGASDAYVEEDDDRRGRGRRGGGGGMSNLGGGGGFGGFTTGIPGARPGNTAGVYMGAELLLFRFFDLTVQPGRTYQYRVRLVLTNPNFGKTLADVMEPYMLEGETRETPWSKPSEAVEIPSDYDIFLSMIRGGQSVNPSDASAIFHVYEWEQSIGTFILGTGRVNYGDMITFTSPTRVLRLHKKTADKENIEFNTSDVLLDGFTAPEIRPNEHPDLALSNPNSERPLEGLLLDEAVVMNQFGEIGVLDPYSRKEDLEEARKANDATFALAEFIKKAGATATDGAEGNPLRRGRGKRERD